MLHFTTHGGQAKKKGNTVKGLANCCVNSDLAEYHCQRGPCITRKPKLYQSKKYMNTPFHEKVSTQIHLLATIFSIGKCLTDQRHRQLCLLVNYSSRMHYCGCVYISFWRSLSLCFRPSKSSPANCYQLTIVKQVWCELVISSKPITLPATSEIENFNQSAVFLIHVRLFNISIF